jgi:hypothetical protein
MWLSMRNKLAEDLVVRREYPTIMEKAVDMAKKGTIRAMEFCADRAWPEDQELEDEMTLSEMLRESMAMPHAMPTWDEPLDDAERLPSGDAAEESHLLEKSRDKPE